MASKILKFGVAMTVVAFVAADSANDEWFECKGGETEKPADWEIYGGFILLFFGVILSLGGLAVSCEEYFIPALKRLCIRYNIPDSVAGSSIMAAGADSPELFVSILGLFAEDSALGIGTVVGSEVFNHMCISAGAVAYAEGGKFKVDWRTFTREMFFYFISLFLFIYGITGNVSGSIAHAFDRDTWGHCLNITFGRSMVLVSGQVIYIAVSAYFEQICAFFEKPEPDTSNVELGAVSSNPMNNTKDEGSSAPARPKAPVPKLEDEHHANGAVEWRKSEWDEIKMGDDRGSIAVDFLPAQWKPRASELFPAPGEGKPGAAGEVAVDPSRRSSMHTHDENHVWNVPEETHWKIWYYMMLPLNLAFFYTIPDVRNDKRKDDFFKNIAVSVSWIAILAYVLCECLQEFGVLFGIPAVVMGLTFSAVGTSFPNLYASMIVAREGKGEMALSNALGSNIFNIFIALGLPWALYCAIYQKPYNELQNGGIIYLTILLMVICIIYYAAIALNDFTIDKRYVCMHACNTTI